MFRFLRYALFPAMLAPTVFAVAALAEEAPPKGAIESLNLAARLYAHALANDDALSAVVALRLVQGVTPLEAGDWQKTTADVDGNEAVLAVLPPEKRSELALAMGQSGDEGLSELELVSGGIEAMAREMAADDPILLGLIDDALAETGRGRIGGANQHVVTLAPGKKDTWEIPFAGKELAEVGVFGDGSGGLAWQVAGSDGAPICQDIYSEEALYCAFRPPMDGTYIVTVISRSNVEGRYMLATN